VEAIEDGVVAYAVNINPTLDPFETSKITAEVTQYVAAAWRAVLASLATPELREAVRTAVGQMLDEDAGEEDAERATEFILAAVAPREAALRAEVERLHTKLTVVLDGAAAELAASSEALTAASTTINDASQEIDRLRAEVERLKAELATLYLVEELAAAVEEEG
jgi:hypothetical protein